MSCPQVPQPLAPPIIIRQAVDRFVLDDAPRLIWWAAGGLLLLALVQGAIDFLRLYLTAVMGQRIVFEIRNAVFEHLSRLSFSFYDRARSGDLMSRVTADVDALNTPRLPLDFQVLRAPLGPETLSLVERPGFLRLKGRESIGSRYLQALVARRQQAFRYRAATCLEFDPTHFKHAAGMICLYDQETLFYLKIGFEEGLGRRVEIMTLVNGVLDFPLAEPIPIPAAVRWVLAVAVNYDRLQFSHGPEEGPLVPVGGVFDASILSDEHCREGKYTGAFVGLCCQDLTGSRHHADFDWFEYEEWV